MDYEVGSCKNCGGRLYYTYCLDEVRCEEYCNEDDLEEEIVLCQKEKL